MLRSDREPTRVLLIESPPTARPDLGALLASWGLGLGPAVVQGLVELHGGSARGGAELTVRLPAAAAAEPRAERPGGPVAAGRSSST